MNRLILTIFVLFIFTPICFAFDYQASCHYLDSISGLSTTGDSTGCLSSYKMLDSYRSNLAYYTEGSKSYIDNVYLVLNVYYGSNRESLHNSLIQAAKTLSKKAINYELPQSIIACLRNGSNGVWKHDKYKIRIIKKIFPNNRGYEIHFIIEE